MKSEVFTIARGGYAIPTRRWSPDGAPRAVVQIAHGLAEHSARYERLALALTKAGYVVVANDHRGHGPNCRPADLGFFADPGGWRECLEDLEAVAHGVAADFPGLPLVFFGHSMGSFLGQTHIAEHGAELAAAILSGPSGPPAAMLPIGRGIAGFERWRLGPRGKSPLVQSLLFGELNKPFKPARTPFDWLSRDPAEVDIYISDPLLYFYISDPLCGFEVTTQLAIDLVDGLAGLASPEIAARVPKALPIYIFSGSRDPVGAKLQGLIDVYRAARPQPALRPNYIPKRATRLSTRSTAPRSPPISSHGSMPTSVELRVSPSIARGRRRCRPCPSVLRCARPGGGKCRRT